MTNHQRTAWTWGQPPRGGGRSNDGGKQRHRTPPRPRHDGFWNATLSSIPQWTGASLKTFMGITLVIYVLNQKALLPKPISAVVSKVLFWPTMPITVGIRIGRWSTMIDDTVVMGGAPFGFAHYPERLRDEYGVRGIVNLCDEYNGPLQKYKQLGMSYLHLPTVDHFVPSVSTLESAVHFIQKHKADGKRVYVHCRAGHGRSAAAVFAWLLYKDPNVNRKELNRQFCMLRNVKSSLWKQPSIVEFHRRLQRGEFVCNSSIRGG